MEAASGSRRCRPGGRSPGSVRPGVSGLRRRPTGQHARVGDPHALGQVNTRAWAGLPRRQRAFLSAYVACFGNISRAALAASIERTKHYRWLEASAAFADAFRVAHADASERMEAEATRRAFHGVVRPVYQGGVLVGYVNEYSDRLAEILLKGNLPDGRQHAIDALWTRSEPRPPGLLVRWFDPRLTGSMAGVRGGGRLRIGCVSCRVSPRSAHRHLAPVRGIRPP